MTLQEALERILFLDPFYQKYHAAQGRVNDLEKERDTWQKQCMEMTLPEPPIIIGSIDSSAIIDLYTKIFPHLQDNLNSLFKIYRGEFQYTTIDEILRFVLWDKTNYQIYTPNIFDCNDFAAHLWGMFASYGWSALPVGFTVGNIYGTDHSIVSVVACPSTEDTTPKVYFLEPQNDTIISEKDINPNLLSVVVFH